MDDLDRAKELEQQQRDQALARVLQREPQPAQQRDDDGMIICMDCGWPIPLARLAVKPDAVRCIDCKTLLERKVRRG